MANAFKCDRCQQLYEDPELEYSIKFERMAVRQIKIGDRNVYRGWYDMCPDCAHEFVDWFSMKNVGETK